MVKGLSQEDKEILLAESHNRTLPEWLEYFNGQYTKHQVLGFLQRNKLKYKKISGEELSRIQRQNATKHKKNTDFFKVWSSDMAYILGLWWTDGCIYSNGTKRLFDITLHSNDKYILDKIREVMKVENPLIKYKDRNAYRLNFASKDIYDDLVALGGEERKSLTCIFPYVPTEYLPDFIRGVFDGDGSVYVGQNGRLNTNIASGSEKFIYSLLDILHKHSNIEGGSIHKNINGVYILQFGKKDSLQLADFMYTKETDLFLIRKKELFYKFKEE
jgi:hypothetical protein